MGNPAGSFRIPVPPTPLDRELPPPDTPVQHARSELDRLQMYFQRRWEEMPERLRLAGLRADELARRARPVAARWQHEAHRFYRHTRNQAERTALEHPMETIAGVAGAAFLLGFLVRVTRRS